ncbi:MAG: hypothetical protein HYY06_22480 [Deltaproteobacteria bacterium]|nr:hypothetical protein [Deltaproteobacteria bacterium]
MPAGANLRKVALANGIDLDREQLLGLNCKNLGICGVCKVWVKEKAPGATSPRGFREKHLFFRYFKGWRRLACQVHVLGDIEVWTVSGGRDRMGARDIHAPPTPSAGAIPPPAEPVKEKKAAKATENTAAVPAPATPKPSPPTGEPSATT